MESKNISDILLKAEAQKEFYRIEAINHFSNVQNLLEIEIGFKAEPGFQLNHSINTFKNIDTIELSEEEQTLMEVEEFFYNSNKAGGNLNVVNIDNLLLLKNKHEKFYQFFEYNKSLFDKMEANKKALVPYDKLTENSPTDYEWESETPESIEWELHCNTIYKNILQSHPQHKKLAEVAEIIYRPVKLQPSLKYSFFIFDDMPEEHLVIENRNVVTIDEIAKTKWQQVKKGDVILASKKGFTVHIAYVTDEYDNCICPSDFTVLKMEEISGNIMALFFQIYPINCILKLYGEDVLNITSLLNLDIPIFGGMKQDFFNHKINTALKFEIKYLNLNKKISLFKNILLEQGETAAMFFWETNYI